MITLKLKYDKILQFLIVSTLDNIFHLNDILFLSDLSLDKILKVCLYNSWKNATKLRLLAQVVAEINKNYHI